MSSEIYPVESIGLPTFERFFDQMVEKQDLANEGAVGEMYALHVVFDDQPEGAFRVWTTVESPYSNHANSLGAT